MYIPIQGARIIGDRHRAVWGAVDKGDSSPVKFVVAKISKSAAQISTRIAGVLPQLQAKFNIQKHFESIKPKLRQVEARILQQADCFDPSVRGYVEYAVETVGKRIRPALCLLSAEASGGIKDSHYDLAVVVELIHLASLIHDDVMDGALVRRSKATCNSKWGTEMSVLLGDMLLAHSLKVCTGLSSHPVSRMIAESSSDVCCGEIIQTQRLFDLKFSIPEYLKTIEMKTAALFSAATHGAALLNDLPDAWCQAFRSYGAELGIAYQIYDDCVDMFGSEESTGKTLGTDLFRGKLTLPVLYLLQQVKGNEADKIAEQILRKDDAGASFIQAKVVEYGGHRYAARKAQDHLEKAVKSLSIIDSNDSRKALEAIPQALHDYIGTLK